MNPILLEIAGLSIPSFGVMLAIAFVLGGGWFIWRGHQKGASATVLLDGLPWIIFASLIGARLLYLVFFPEQFVQDPWGTLLGRGGLVWYGGVIGVLATTVIICLRNRIYFGDWMDWFTPPAILGLALGRIGCFLAGCCFGGPCSLPWAVQYPVGHETHPHWVHPAPLYESISALGLMLILIGIERYFTQSTIPLKRGSITAIGLIGYGIIRFTIEYARGDRLIWLELLNLSASQTISLVLIAIAAIWLVVQNRRQPVNTLVEESSSRRLPRAEELTT